MTRTRSLVAWIVCAAALLLGTFGFAQWSFGNPKAPRPISAEQRLENALDGAVAAAVENVRLLKPLGCPAEPLVLRDVDDAAAFWPSVQEISVHVACSQTGEQAFQLLATAYQVQAACIPQTGSRSLAPALEAEVEVTENVATQRIATTVSRHLVADSAECVPEQEG